MPARMLTNVNWGGRAETLQSRTIDVLRFPLAFLVIYIHSFGDPLTENPDLGVAVYDNLRIFMSHIISRVTVPLFYLMSGYLFFYKAEDFSKAVYLKKLKSRCRTILMPYLVWNLLYIFNVVVRKIGKGIQHPDYDSVGEIIAFFSSHGWLNMFWSCNVWPFRTSWFGWDLPSSGPIMTPLWFLRDLMVVMLLSYVLYKLIKRFGLSFILFLFFCSISGLWPNIPGLSAGCFLYFGLGAYMAINHKNMLVEFSRYAQPILLTTAVLTILMVIFKSDFTFIGNCIYPVFVFFGVIATFILAGHYMTLHADRKIPKVLSRSSFFIYVSHTFLILGYCTSALKKVLPDGNVALITLRYLLIPVLCVTACLLLYNLMERYTPSLLRLLTGNRTTRK